MSLQFDRQTVIVTGVGHGFGRLYATYFASCGANVVVHDGKNPSVVDATVKAIHDASGSAIADYSTSQHGGDIIRAAMQHYGRVDILILNTSPRRMPAWAETEQKDWNALLEESFKPLYKCVHAAWPHFKKQKYGRIVATSAVVHDACLRTSPIESAAAYAHLGFIQTVASEGAKYNILASTVAPSTYSGTDSVSIDTESLLRSIAALAHAQNQTETGHMYTINGSQLRKLQWQRASGASLNPDNGLSAASILSQWDQVNDFSQPTYATGSADFAAVLQETSKLPGAMGMPPIRMQDRVVLVTGAGSGLGRAYAIHFASLGARVVVNDIRDASAVVNEIRKVGGEAHFIPGSVDKGEEIVASTVQTYGRIDVVINNAGIVRDKSIGNMTDDLWDTVVDVHVNSMFKVTKAAWPYMQRQCYGRIINITSTSGIYGNFGQSNYSLAKCAVIGFSKALAIEGADYNIRINAIAPVASTPALAVAIEGSATNILPIYSAPFLALMCSDDVPHPSSGGIYEIGAGWHARTRQQCSNGIDWKCIDNSQSTALSTTLRNLSNFDTWPTSYPEEDEGNITEVSRDSAQLSPVQKIEKAKHIHADGSIFEYKTRDVILYNLTVGAKHSELSLVYEKDPSFGVLPTFASIPYFATKLPFQYDDILPNYNFSKLLHGEIYTEIRAYPIPTSAKLVTNARLLSVLDKGKAAIVVVGYTTRDALTGHVVFYNESSAYIRDAGGFGGSNVPSLTKGRQGKPVRIPSRRPDFTRQEKTHEELAALYRLNGDTNDLHIDPAVAVRAGYQRPILHGLCSFGISGKHLYQKYGPYKSIRARFAGVVLPGQTLTTEAWEEHGCPTIHFQVRVVETGKLCIAAGSIELIGSHEHSRL